MKRAEAAEMYVTEVKRLRQENLLLRQALEDIAKMRFPGPHQLVARNALKEVGEGG